MIEQKTIEQKIVDYLKDKGYVAYAERPPTPPTEYIIIDRIRTERTVNFYKVNVAVQSIAPTLEDAMALNEEIIDIMLNIVNLNGIAYCRLDNSYNYTNSTAKQYKYQATFDIGYYKGE